jgi:hypothetical protein
MKINSWGFLNLGRNDKLKMIAHCLNGCFVCKINEIFDFKHLKTSRNKMCEMHR